MNYYQFPKTLLLHNEISANAKICYMLLYDMQRANKSNEKKLMCEKNSICIRQATIAYKLKLSERQVQRILNELEKNKLISRCRYKNDITQYIIHEP